jgi:hypothetical protein
LTPEQIEELNAIACMLLVSSMVRAAAYHPFYQRAVRDLRRARACERPSGARVL